MALTTIPLPFGVRDIAVFPLAGDTPGTGVDFPNARTLQFAEAEAFENLEGDDKTVASHGKGPLVNWTLEGGGYSFEAVKTMFGGTITTSGTTPAQKKTLNKKVTDERPYFRVEGQSISDSGGDFHVVIYRCKATGDLAGTMGNGAFFLTGASGQGFGNTDDDLYDFVQNETAVDIELS